MADKEVTISVKGAEETFKNLDKSIQALNKSLTALAGKQKAVTDASKKQGAENKKEKTTVEQTTRVFNKLGSAFGGNLRSLTSLAGGLTAAVPQLAAVQAGVGALWEGLKRLYKETLSQNRRIFETGDAFAFLDTSTQDVGVSLTKFGGDLDRTGLRTSFVTASVKDHLAALKGYQTAGLIVTNTADKFRTLGDATALAIRYGTLFTIGTEEMAKIIGEFTRELNISGDMGAEAFSEIFNASVKARYGTRNFLNIVQQTVPTMSYYGGSINEVSRLLQFMGKSGVISMKQAQSSITALTTGIKDLNAERRIEIAALVGQDKMVEIIRDNIERLKGDMGKLNADSKEYMVKQMELSELQRDLASASEGSFIAMGEAMKRVGSAGAMEMILSLPEKFLGMQITSLDQLINLSGEQRFLAAKALERAGISEQHLEILKKMAATAGSEGITTREQFIDYLQSNAEEITKQMETDAQKAERMRELTQDRIANMLENLLFVVMNEVAPYVQMATDYLMNLVDKAFGSGSVQARQMKAVRILLTNAKKDEEKRAATAEAANMLLKENNDLSWSQRDVLTRLSTLKEQKFDRLAYTKKLRQIGEEDERALLKAAGILEDTQASINLGKTGVEVATAIAGGALPVSWGKSFADYLFPDIKGLGKATVPVGGAGAQTTVINLNQTINTRDSEEAAQKIKQELITRYGIASKSAQ